MTRALAFAGLAALLVVALVASYLAGGGDGASRVGAARARAPAVAPHVRERWA